VPTHAADVTVVHTPVRSIVCTSTTHIPHLDYLGVSSKLVGFPTTDYISSEIMRQRIDAGLVKDLGVDHSMDSEALFALKPDVVMGYTMAPGLGSLKKIKDRGIPVVVNAEYLEPHPLGRAEWIKFTALFFGRQHQADSVFKIVEDEYLRGAGLVKNETVKPTVMCGILYGDTWFAPGGKNHAAQLLYDAGAQYVWQADASQGFLEISFESMYRQAGQADLWIGVGSFKSKSEMAAAESRYALFKPFQTGQVYTYDGRKGKKGGSEFLELGYLRPDIVLMDLVAIVHPGKLPGYTPYFHRKID